MQDKWKGIMKQIISGWAFMFLFVSMCNEIMIGMGFGNHFGSNRKILALTFIINFAVKIMLRNQPK